MLNGSFDWDQIVQKTRPVGSGVSSSIEDEGGTVSLGNSSIMLFLNLNARLDLVDSL